MKKKWIAVFIALMVMLSVAACKPSDSVNSKTFTVTFDTGVGGSEVTAQNVSNGKKVTKPADPTNEAGDAFVSWQLNSRDWKFDIDIVTSAITLKAKWRAFTTKPTEVSMADSAFTSTLNWFQGETDGTQTKVYIKSVLGGEYTELIGTRSVTAGTGGMNIVAFTPTAAPLGGRYNVKIQTVIGETAADTEVKDEAGALLTFLFAGAGTTANPYLVAKNADIRALIGNESMYGDKNFKQVENITHVAILDPIFVDDTAKITFSGVYDGGNKELGYQGNGGLFHKIAAGGTVKNVVLSGVSLTASTANAYAIGGLADENLGTIENVTSRTAIANEDNGSLTADMAVPAKSDVSTGAGGIVGLNAMGGVIKNCIQSGSGAVKAKIGNGGIAAFNFGTIQNCSSSATLPAGNQANSGKSSKNYSFAGGIAGFNYGTVKQCSVTGRIFGQSAYANDDNQGYQQAFGGIVGYNGAGATIEESSFARAVGAKEFIPKSLGDAANVGVASIHGDKFVGGIAGINDGAILYSYVNNAIIGGRDYVGGIAGKMGASARVTNSYSAAEIAIKDDSGLPVSAASGKTTLTTYPLYPQVGTNANNVSIALKTVGGGVWQSGNTVIPVAPSVSAQELATLNSGSVKYNANGVLLWQTGIVTGITLNYSETTVMAGSVGVITATVLPESAPDKAVVWTSSDPAVAEIVGDGEIKGLKAGTVTITATTRDGGKVATCAVTVMAYEINVYAAQEGKEDLLLIAGSNDRVEYTFHDTFSIKITVTPELKFTNLIFRSSNSLATVSADGIVTVTDSPNGNFSIFAKSDQFAEMEFKFISKAA